MRLLANLLMALLDSVQEGQLKDAFDDDRRYHDELVMGIILSQ